MTSARKLVVTEGEQGIYHCVSRCVRRAYLCGYDKVLKKSFDHRKEWVRTRLMFLVEVFCIEVLAYALMDNHQHTLLRTLPDILKALSDEEVARRWLKLYPTKVGLETAIQALVSNKERIALIRERLGSISWFMKSYSEFIARRANKEDDCKGRFWEGRFKCQRICDEAALLACSMYVDLNPIRAGMAKTPEESEFTSAWERIVSIKRTKKLEHEPPLWIAPIADTPLRQGYLPLSLKEYLSLLDATGREIRKDKRGCIPSTYDPILTRIGLNSLNWLETATSFGQKFASFAGSPPSLLKIATLSNKAWLKGTKFAHRMFL